jgi:indolepyruvate ferredoxin oxidoreductase, alpha subunit
LFMQEAFFIYGLHKIWRYGIMEDDNFINNIMANKIKKEILLGNEAIVYGALEAGVNFVSAYPGTPSSEIGNTFYEIAQKHNVYFEFSANEKVALEASIGASYSGLRCLVAMKNFGVNVASDALLPFVYTGVKGGTVIVVADDPSCWSSGQSEENSRGFSFLAHIPILEPSDAQEAKDFTKLGFEISEKFKIPVMLRITTRVAHQRMPVTMNLKPKAKKEGKFIKDKNKFITMPPRVLEMKDELFEKLEEMKAYAEKSGVNKIEKAKKNTGFGIITSGVSYLHVKEVLNEMNLDVPVLKINLFYPLAEKTIIDFTKNLKKVLVVEELEGYLEKETKLLAKDSKLKVYGKDVLPVSRELNQEKVMYAVSKVLGRKYNPPKTISVDLPKRTPRLYLNCPYWFVFSAIKKVAPKTAVFGGDIGCYMLAYFPPHEIQDYLLCMGSSIGVGHGISKATNQKVIALIGDSTFFHAGMPALVNTVSNVSNPLIIILDNRITAMTGHQPRPGACDSKTQNKTCTELNIENIVRAYGVKHVKTVDPIQPNAMEKAIKEFINKDETSVIVASRMCAYLAERLNK